MRPPVNRANLAGDPGFDYLLGIAAMDSGHLTHSIFAPERVLAVEPDNLLARAEIARVYLMLGEVRTSQQEFETVSKSENLVADFGKGTVVLNMDMTVNGTNYVTTDLPMSLGSPDVFTFSGSGSTISPACVSSCFTNVEGFFAGDDASHAGLGYKADISGADYINGAAAFKKD